MARETLNDLVAFLAVARERSFTKAAAQLGVSQSALSHTIRTLEARLGIRLLTRTTRSVSLTDAGERFFASIGPHLDQIEAEVAALGEFRDKPAGTIRITTSSHAADAILWPRLIPFLKQYPDVKVELIVESGLTNIVEERYDAGVRLGEQVEKDMIAVRIGPEMRMACVASPEYFREHPIPKVPQDLTEHNCINLRLTSYGGLYAWEFEKKGRVLNVRVDGQLVFNNTSQVMTAALAGFGIGYVIEEAATAYIASGRLTRVLGDWSPPFPGYHLYFPNRRQSSPAFALLLEALRYRP